MINDHKTAVVPDPPDAGDGQTAEDLLQETLLRAWRKIDELSSDVSHLRRWLFTVAPSSNCQ
jgi:DNA-directed RNA polymerase specialized sigma24 family protein